MAAPRGQLDALKQKLQLQEQELQLFQQLEAAKAAGQQYDQAALADLQRRHQSVDKLTDKINKLNDKIKEGNALQIKQMTNFDDMDASLASITNTLGKNNAITQTVLARNNQIKTTVTSIAQMMEGQNQLNEAQVDIVAKATEKYKESQSVITRAKADLAQKKITAEEYNKTLQRQHEELESITSQIDTSTQLGQDLHTIFHAATDETESFANAAQRAADKIEGMGGALDHIGSSGIPLARELSNAIGEIGKQGKLSKAALVALGAAAGVLAYDYFGAGVQASVKASMDVKENQIEGAKQVAQAQNELAFAGKKAAQDFGFELQQMAAQFRAAAKTALFGKGLGSVGYGAAQLQLAGISAENIAEATKAASSAGNGSAALAADMAIFANRAGLSADNVADIQKTFKILDKVSAKTALNLAEGTRAMAEQAGLNVGDVMNEVASASEIALEAQIRSSDQLAKQVVYAKSMGVSFSAIAKAGQNMVLNYKDSIKAEMQLSTMLGKNVNLSEVRAKFMAGDQAGALDALKAQGLDPKQMNMFQQQALQQALGGMNLQDIAKIGQEGFQEDAKMGGVTDLQAKSAKSANDAFLALKQAAEGGLKSETAIISAKQAVADAKLQTEIAEAWLNSPAYTNYLADMAKLEKERALKENAGRAAAGGLGALLTNLIPSNLKFGKAAGGPGGLKNLISPSAMSKGVKAGGAGLAGIFGGVSGFMEKKEEGGTTGEAVGAGAIQGGLAAGGAALGAAFGGPLGMMVGGFLGDTLGGWINDNFPQVSARFGGVWDKMTSKFTAIGEKFKPVMEAIDKFLSKIGFEGGLGGVFYSIGEALVNTVIAPFEILIGVFGFVFDIVGALGQLLTGKWGDAWNTLKNGFLDLMKTVFGPFQKIFIYIYNGFASMWNWLAESWLGETLGLGKMEKKSLPVEASVATEVANNQAAANEPVVEATADVAKEAKAGAKASKDTKTSVDKTGNIMNEVVAMLAVNATLLEEVVYNTAGQRQINLNGKRVNNALLETSRKNYGIGK